MSATAWESLGSIGNRATDPVARRVRERGHRRLEARAGFGDPALEEPLDADAARDLGVELGVASPVQAGERLGRLAQLTVDEVVRPHRGGRGHDVDAGADAFAELQTAPVVDGRARCAESLHAHVTAPAHDAHGELRPCRAPSRRAWPRRASRARSRYRIASASAAAVCAVVAATT